MSENLTISQGSKRQKYEELLPQIAALIKGESDLTAKMANISAALKQTFDFLWVGFYVVKNNELVVSAFQGPIACLRIAFGRGVCGTAWKEAKTIIVEDVEKFPGHIACSSLSKSEIVVPVFLQGEIIAVLDIDSADLNTFDETDRTYLEKLTALL